MNFFIILFLITYCHEIKVVLAQQDVPIDVEVLRPTVAYSKQGGYVVITNAVVPGFISDTLDNNFTKDRYECEKLCLKYVSCDLWSFDRNSKRCILRRNIGRDLEFNLYHDSGIKKKGNETGSITLDYGQDRYRILRKIGPTFEKSEIKGDPIVMSIYANGTWPHGRVGNSEECRLACLYENLCDVWTYSTVSSLCYLKENYSGEIVKNNYTISGMIEPFRVSTIPPPCEYTFFCSINNETNQWGCPSLSGRCGVSTGSTVAVDCEVKENTHCYGLIQKFESKKLKNAKECCEMCRDDLFCFTWYFKNNGKCFGFYDKKECKNRVQYNGGTFI